MEEKRPSFEIVDRRGANKPPVVREVPAAPIEPTGDIHSFRSTGYTIKMAAYPNVGTLLVCRAVGLRGDGLLALADWVIPPVITEGVDAAKYARKRLDTFLGCECVQRKPCAQHEKYLEQWFKSDIERMNLMAGQPMSEALEVYMRAEMAQAEAQRRQQEMQAVARR